MDPSSFTVMSLCAGIGGLDLGLRLAIPSARTVCVVEREAFAIAHLVQKMEDGHLDPAPIWTDLTRFDGKAWRGVVDCIIGGYPCQPFSVAGRRAGTDDPRHLFPHIARIIAEVQPAVVFFENVDAHLTLGFEEVGERLQALGYIVAAGVFSASEVGAPHRRKRLFILAHHHSHGREGFWMGGDERLREHEAALGHDADRRGGEAEPVEDSKSNRRWDQLGWMHGQTRQPSDVEREALQRRSSPELRSDAASADASVEDSLGLGRRGRGHGDARGSGRQVQAEGSCSPRPEPVADAGCGRYRRDPQDSLGQAVGRATPEWDGGAVENPDSRDAESGQGHDGICYPEQLVRPHNKHSQPSPCANARMANTDITRLEKRDGQRGHARQELKAALGNSLFPPSPSDYEAWSQVEASAQPAVCGVANGGSIRVDRLRALGNGVVPLVAAVAFRTLAKDLGLL